MSLCQWSGVKFFGNTHKHIVVAVLGRAIKFEEFSVEIGKTIRRILVNNGFEIDFPPR